MLFEDFAEFQLVLHDDSRGVLAEGHTVPCARVGAKDGLGDGLDAMIAGAFEAREAVRSPSALGVLAAEIRPEFRANGRSTGCSTGWPTSPVTPASPS
jgi:hypothetical protein